MKVNVLSRLGIITSDFLTNEDEIKNLLDQCGVKFYKISNGIVDVAGSISNDSIEKIIDANGHFKVKFGKVGGAFDCSHCKNLTSLEGAPQKVGGNFNCSSCDNITSLEGAPQKVGGDFKCRYCSKSIVKQAIDLYGERKVAF